MFHGSITGQRFTTMRLFSFALLGLLSISRAPAAAEQKPVSKAARKPGIVSGRVFGITSGGDLKPARMADVYLLYVYRKADLSGADKEYQESAGGGNRMDQELKRITGYGQWLSGEGSSASESIRCRRELLSYEESVIQTMKWAQRESKDWQVIAGNSDEEGAFNISVPHPGKYRASSHGQGRLQRRLLEC
jgi:hypothetical protein